MGQPGPTVITGGSQENLGFMLQAPKGLGINDPVPITLKSGTQRTLVFFPHAAFGRTTQTGEGRQGVPFSFLKLFSDIHRTQPP
jgi:hypothetical protein